MKTKDFLVLVTILSTFSLMAGCADSGEKSSEKENVHGVITQTFFAIQSQDWETMRRLISEDWLLFTDAGSKWNLQEMQRFFKDHMSDHRIGLSNITIQVSKDGTMAWAKFDEETEYKFDGSPVKEKAIFTAVLEKRNDAWIMVHLHRSTPHQPSNATT
jgi:ketosteroid isomerase-like protein